jgi:enoyl-CoA hydratase
VSGGEPDLVRSRRGAVEILRLNRPEARNAYDPDLLADLSLALVEAEADDEIRAVVLTGTGDRAFCAGMDLRAFASGTAGSGPRHEAGMAAFQRFIAGEIGVPVIGAANAAAVAGGCELLLACDLVVAADTARIGLPEVQRGLIAGGGGLFVSNRLPLAVALELTLTGDPIDAARALALGLVNQVVPAAQVVDAAVALAERVARNGPLAVRATKEVVRLAAEDMARARARQAEWLPTIFGSEDAREGATAFVERRPPRWQGR